MRKTSADGLPNGATGASPVHRQAWVDCRQEIARSEHRLNSNSAIPAALRQNCCPVGSGARNALMETTETQPGHHWSLTLLGMALIVMFAYYGESVLAVLFVAILLSFMISHSRSHVKITGVTIR